MVIVYKNNHNNGTLNSSPLHSHNCASKTDQVADTMGDCRNWFKSVSMLERVRRVGPADGQVGAGRGAFIWYNACAGPPNFWLIDQGSGEIRV